MRTFDKHPYNVQPWFTKWSSSKPSLMAKQSSGPSLKMPISSLNRNHSRKATNYEQNHLVELKKVIKEPTQPKNPKCQKKINNKRKRKNLLNKISTEQRNSQLNNFEKNKERCIGCSEEYFITEQWSLKTFFSQIKYLFSSLEIGDKWIISEA